MNAVARHAALFLSLLVVGCAPADSISASVEALDDEALPEGAGGGADGWLASPIASPRVTSRVSHRSGRGWVRSDCVALSRANHRGTDFGVASGTPVRAAAAGTVLRSVTGCPNTGSMSSTCGGGFGNHVIVQHAGGIATLYAHFSASAGQVRVGARVECGDLLGASGHSGRSTGPHLHFEVRSGVSSVASYFGSGRTLDPWGGACSSQPEALWSGGSPTSSCAPSTPRDDAAVARATHAREVRGTPGMRISQVFTWRNTGSTTWTSAEHAMVHTSGAFSSVDLVALPSGASVRPGQQIDLRVDVTVPEAAALHRGVWRMARIGGAIFGREAALAVRVPGAPRECRSATLGRDVPSGSCVQVSYPGCGLSTCAWFQCSDGAWYCTEGDACSGEAFANDSCEMPSAGDGGMPLPGDAGETMCAPGGSACGSATECCGGMACAMGFCECVPAEQLCMSDSDCCTGLACLAGACRDPGGLALEQAACSARAECAYPLNCQASAVGGSTECCVSGGNRCERDGDCCGEMACGAGHCEAREAGQSCANLLDCGGAYLCRDNVCAL